VNEYEKPTRVTVPHYSPPLPEGAVRDLQELPDFIRSRKLTLVSFILPHTGFYTIDTSVQDPEVVLEQVVRFIKERGLVQQDDSPLFHHPKNPTFRHYFIQFTTSISDELWGLIQKRWLEDVIFWRSDGKSNVPSLHVEVHEDRFFDLEPLRAKTQQQHKRDK